jgi:hypothetical protein
MDSVLSHLKWSMVLVYLDDLLVFGRTFEEHNESLELVLKALCDARLTLKPSKCHFAAPKVRFLGHIVSEHGIEVNPEKVQAISEFPTPKKLKDVRSFLSLCSFYRRFVPNFAQIPHPLIALSKKDVPLQ